MRRLIEYFDQAYIINLSDRGDRRRDVQREFDQLGMRIPNNKIKFYTATRPLDKGVYHDIGIRGNSESHRGVLELALRDGLRNILVFEDDVSFREIHSNVEERLLALIPVESWDIIYLGYSEGMQVRAEGPLLEWHEDVLGGHFYAVNGRFIGKMLQYMYDCETRVAGHPHGGPACRDATYNNMRRLHPEARIFLSIPNLAFQSSSRTDLHPLGLFDKSLLLRPTVRAMRFVKNRVRKAVDKHRLRRSHEQ